MSHFHVMIATEMRKPVTLPDGTVDKSRLALAHDNQLHNMGAGFDPTNTNIIYCAEWDGVSPYVIVHKGKLSDIKMAYAGWPMVDQNGNKL